MLWVSELTVERWTPCADVLDSAVRHLVFIKLSMGRTATLEKLPVSELDAVPLKFHVSAE